MSTTPLVFLTDMREHLNVISDDDNELILRKIAVAEEWIGAFIGKPLADFDPLPEPLKEAVRQLVAHLYENREATIVGLTITDVSPGLFDLMAPYREWTF